MNSESQLKDAKTQVEIAESQLETAQTELEKAIVRVKTARAHLQVVLQLQATEAESEKIKLLEKIKILEEANKILKENLAKAKKGNPKVFFDLSFRKAPAERIVMELYADTKPYKAEIFRALCTGEKGFSSIGNRLHYKGKNINYLYYNRIMAGGNIAGGNISEAVSIHGDMTATGENLLVNKHTGPGDLTMFLEEDQNKRHSFGITLMKNPSNYGRETVIGKVIEGMNVLNAINQAYPGEGRDLPANNVVIVNCGELV